MVINRIHQGKTTTWQASGDIFQHHSFSLQDFDSNNSIRLRWWLVFKEFCCFMILLNKLLDYSLNPCTFQKTPSREIFWFTRYWENICLHFYVPYWLLDVSFSASQALCWKGEQTVHSYLLWTDQLGSHRSLPHSISVISSNLRSLPI